MPNITTSALISHLDSIDIELEEDGISSIIKDRLSDDEITDDEITEEIVNEVTDYIIKNVKVSGWQQVDVDIDVDEFLEECSSWDIDCVIDWLKDEKHINDTDIELEEIIEDKITDGDLSILESEWYEYVFKLSKLRLMISNEDEEIIKNIINKY
jgi:hypothetical protein